MASLDDYLGSVSLWAGNYSPRDWAFCGGQLLSIAQFDALFSLLGTAYGGDGRVTFGVPDMKGRAPVGAGQSPGTSNYPLGIQAGLERTVLGLPNLPTHTHTAGFEQTDPLSGEVVVEVFDGNGLVPSGNLPAGKYLGPSGASLNLYYDSPTDQKFLADAPVMLLGVPGSVSLADNGGSQPFYITQPYTVLNYIIMIEGGFYPPRH